MGTITSREGYVDQVIGSAYQVVRYVAANMQSIIDVSGAMPQLELWMPNITSVLAAMPTISNVNTNLPVITNINSNLTMLSNVNANMAALLNINSNMAALLAIPGVIQAQDFKNSVAVATTTNIALTGLQTIDGYSVPVGARVLVKNQTAPAENGIYVAATGSWARSSDGAAGMLSTGCQVSVDRGTVGAGKQFRLETLGTITVGTTAQSWVEMSSASNVVGQEDDGTPLTVLAPHELQFDNQHFSLTAVAQGVAIALSTEILDAIAAGGGGGGSGETNTASNLGTGAGLYAAKVGADLRFKSLVAGTNITFDITSDSITVNATGGGSGGIDVSAVDSLGSSDTITDVQTLAFDPDEFFYDGDALGLGIHLAPGALGAINGVGGATGTGASGHQIFKDKSGTDLRFKTLIAGTNVSITPDVNNNSLTIAATGGGGGGLTIEGSDADNNNVGPVAVSNLYFESKHLRLNEFEPGSYDVFLHSDYAAGKVIYVQGLDDTSTPVATTTYGGLAFSPDFTVAEMGGMIAISLASGGGGGGGGGIPDVPVGSNPYVRSSYGGGTWVESWSYNLILQNTGTISLISPYETGLVPVTANRFRIRGLKQTVDNQIVITPMDPGSGYLDDLQFSIGDKFKSAWDGYFDNTTYAYSDSRVPVGGCGNVYDVADTAIATLTANKLIMLPVYVPYPMKVTGFNMILDAATKPTSGVLTVAYCPFSGYNTTIGGVQEYNWTSLSSGVTNLTVDWQLSPGHYLVMFRSSVSLASAKIGRLVKASPMIMARDPATAILNLASMTRGAVAFQEDYSYPLVLNETFGFGDHLGDGYITACVAAPFIELILPQTS